MLFFSNACVFPTLSTKAPVMPEALAKVLIAKVLMAALLQSSPACKLRKRHHERSKQIASHHQPVWSRISASIMCLLLVGLVDDVSCLV